MKTKLTKNGLLMFFFSIIFMWIIGLFRILPFKIFSSTFPGRYFSVLLLILSFSFWFPKKTYSFRYCIAAISIICLLLSIEILTSKYRYDQSLIRLFMQSSHWSLLLLIFFILQINENQEKIYSFIVRITLIVLLIRTLCWFLYNYKGINLFPNVINEFGIQWKRNENVRFFSTATGSLSVILLFYDLLTYKGKKKRQRNIIDGLLVLFILWFDVFVYQARSESIICIGAICYMYLIYKQHTMKSLLRKIIIILLVIIVIFQTGIIQKVIYSFNVNSETGGTTRSRIYAFDYFYNMYKNNPILGFGILDTSNPRLLRLWSGPDGNRYIDDLGFLGMILQYGVLGIIIYLSIFIRMFSIWINEKNKDKKVLYGGALTIFGLMSILSSNPFDPQRIIVVPLIWGLFEISKINNKKNRIIHSSLDGSKIKDYFQL